MSDYLATFFEYSKLRSVFMQKIFYKGSVGIDKVNTTNFMNRLQYNLGTIEKKMVDEEFRFTPYREFLISKGKRKLPRVISIPTVRDRVVLQCINQYLQKEYLKQGEFKISQSVISELLMVIEENKFDSFFKLDLTNFYGTLNHNLLINALDKNEINDEISSLIALAISTPTVGMGSLKNEREERNNLGVPQGLSISNVLASYYLLDFDSIYIGREDLHYVRYVDDIIVLCNSNKLKDFQVEMTDYLVKDKLLEINESKSDEGALADGFSYLGYIFKNGKISPKKESIRKLEKAIEAIFTKYNNKREKYDYFIWELNLRITGAISENKKYGWLFYFSQVTEERVFFHLDWYVKKMFKRFKISIDESKMQPKRFVRAYNEIVYNLDETNYLPNYDKYTWDDMHDFLKNIYKYDKPYEPEEVETIFKGIVFKSLDSLEKDLQTFS